MSTKIVKLTAANIEALTRMVEYTATDQVTLTKTTATFAGTAREALETVAWFQRAATAEWGGKAHPNASLHAVRRKVEALAAAEAEAEEFTRAESEKVEAIRDSGTLADGLAEAKARSEARAEQDAVNDPLVALLGTDPQTGLTYGASITPKSWVTAHVDEPWGVIDTPAATLAMVADKATAATEAFSRYKAAREGSSAVPGRLRPASKCGQRRPKRGRR